VLREVVADSLERLADGDDRLGMLTVTAVEVTPDLRQAVVYLSSLPEPAAEALGEHRAQLQQAIGRQVRMKRTPLLSFDTDPGVVQGSRVEEILRRIHDDARRARADEDDRGEDRGGRP
jgi:ribosome-binding factor A